MKIVVTKKVGDEGEDPSKKGTYQSQAAVDAANLEAKRFALAHGLGIGPNAYVATKVGDPVVPYTDITGKPTVGPTKISFPLGTIMDIRKVPSSVLPADIKWDMGPTPYYLDPQSGDPQFIHPDIARSTRFVPTRGMSKEDLLAKK